MEMEFWQSWVSFIYFTGLLTAVWENLKGMNNTYLYSLTKNHLMIQNQCTCFIYLGNGIFKNFVLNYFV